MKFNLQTLLVEELKRGYHVLYHLPNFACNISRGSKSKQRITEFEFKGTYSILQYYLKPKGEKICLYCSTKISSFNLLTTFNQKVHEKFS